MKKPNYITDMTGKKIAFPCNGNRPCYGNANCGLVYKLGQCRHTLDPRYAADPQKIHRL